MPSVRRLALPGYAVCMWLVFFPLIDALSLAIPLAPAVAEWRYSLTVLLSQTMMTPLVGLFVGLILAAVFDHKGLHKLLAGLSVIGVLGLLVGIAVFMKDSSALQGVERQGLMPAFSMAWTVAFAKLLFATVFLSVTGWTARALASDEAGEAGVVWGS